MSQHDPSSTTPVTITYTKVLSAGEVITIKTTVSLDGVCNIGTYVTNPNVFFDFSSHSSSSISDPVTVPTGGAGGLVIIFTCTSTSVAWDISFECK